MRRFEALIRVEVKSETSDAQHRRHCVSLLHDRPKSTPVWLVWRSTPATMDRRAPERFLQGATGDKTSPLSQAKSCHSCDTETRSGPCTTRPKNAGCSEGRAGPSSRTVGTSIVPAQGHPTLLGNRRSRGRKPDVRRSGASRPKGHRRLRGQLEPAGDDARNREILIQCVPTKGVSIQFQPNLRQLIVRGAGEDPESVGRESDDPSIVQFDEHDASWRDRSNV